MERLAEIITPLEEETLLFFKMSAHEGLSRMFTYEVDLLSKEKSIAFSDLLGKPMTVKLQLSDGGVRFFNGYVARFGFVGRRGAYYQYHATLRPWLWFLTRTQDCRIFQEKTAVDIIKEVFKDHTVSKFSADDLIATYPCRNYCVQYRETDFNFVSRLLEQEGISYYFKHEENQHTLILVDSNSYSPVRSYEKIPYISQTEDVRKDKESIRSWFLGAEIQTGQYVLNDYDFERSKVGLETRQAKLYDDIEQDDYEVYDYPGGYTTTEAGKHYINARIEQIQSAFLQASGKTDARGLTTGHCFTLSGFPREEQNADYLVVNTHISLVQAYRDAQAVNEGSQFECSFEVAHASNTWRPARLTPKPIVQGPQTAIVVGGNKAQQGNDSQAQGSSEEDDEIHTDKYGRVKVLFHWDREHRRLGAPENSSCWIRVSQPWAGKNFGFMAIPRVGQEVVVDFLEGDPDRPIITGRVYNDDQMPPWNLPEHMTRTGIVTRSTKGGNINTANELRFEDKKGQELIYLHAEHDFSTEVEHDEISLIMHDSTEDVRHNRTAIVKNKDAVIVKEAGQELLIEAGGQNENITGDRMFLLTGDEFVQVTKNRSTKIDETDFLQADKQVTLIDNDASHSYGGALNVLIAKNTETTALGTVTHSAAGEHKLYAPSFEFKASGDINCESQSFNRTCYQIKDTILGTSNRMKVGSSFLTAVGGLNETLFGVRNTLTVGSQMRNDVGATIVARVGLELYQVFGAVVNVKTGTTVNLLGTSSVTTCPVDSEFVVLKTICGGSAAAVAPGGIAAGGIPAQAAVAGSHAREVMALFFQVVAPLTTVQVGSNKVEEAFKDIAHYTGDAKVSLSDLNNAFWGYDTAAAAGRGRVSYPEIEADVSHNHMISGIKQDFEAKRDSLAKPPQPPGGWAKSPPPAEAPLSPEPEAPPLSDEKYTQETKGSTLQDQWKIPGSPPPVEPTKSPS